MKNLSQNRMVQKVMFQVIVGGFITTIIWVGINIYTAWAKGVEVKVDKKVLKPITSRFDAETLKKMENRQTPPINFSLTLEESSQGGRQR